MRHTYNLLCRAEKFQGSPMALEFDNGTYFQVLEEGIGWSTQRA